MAEQSSNEYVLAMYDIRGKQDYIYKRNKLKEIVGASLIIRDCFIDYLFPMAEKVEKNGIYSYRVEKGESNQYLYKKDIKNQDGMVEQFSENDVIEKFNDGYIGYVVYDGGGNFFVLYKSLDVYKKVNKLFYTKVLQETSTLKILTSYIVGVNFDNYSADEKKLREKHTVAERSESAIYPVNSLPIVQSDYSSAMPLTDIVKLPDDNKLRDEKVCRESKAKYDKFNKLSDEQQDEIKKLDDLVEKGVDSHIAVIYIDGNSMGAKVENCLKGKTSYEECINALRAFSEDIQNSYIDIPKKKIENTLTDEEKKKLFRFVVYAGDEITFICNAKSAYKVVSEYFNSLDFENNQSSCAGISIFHSHAPYSEAYRIAEECCETGKKLMKERKMDNVCLLDFHYCQGAIGTSLEDIREHEGTADVCIPWLLRGKTEDNVLDSASNDNDDLISDAKISNMKNVLLKIARSNSKTLLQVSKKSQEVYEQEIERIIAHYKTNSGEGKENKKYLEDNKKFIIENRGLLYRMMMVYDLWFRAAEENYND